MVNVRPSPAQCSQCIWKSLNFAYPLSRYFAFCPKPNDGKSSFLQCVGLYFVFCMKPQNLFNEYGMKYEQGESGDKFIFEHSGKHTR